MDVGIKDQILAIVTTNKNMASNTIPIFYVEKKEELDNKSLLISKCMMGMVHDVGNNTYIIVKH